MKIEISLDELKQLIRVIVQEEMRSTQFLNTTSNIGKFIDKKDNIFPKIYCEEKNED